APAPPQTYTLSLHDALPIYAFLQEFQERAPTEDRHAEPAVDDAVLQWAGPAPFPDHQGRSFQRPRDRLELLRGPLAEAIHVLEELHDEQRVVAAGDEVEAEAPLAMRLGKEEARLGERFPRLLQNRLAFHESFIV